MGSRRDDDDMSSHHSMMNSTPSYRKKLGNKFRFKDTISELYDQDEKEAVYNSSMKKGGAVHEFNETLRADPKLGEALKGTF